MKKALIVYATRYGSARTVSEWICERLILGGITAETAPANENIDMSSYDIILFGSGIYGHKFLPAAENLIKENQTELKDKTTGIFGVAMRTETFFKGGRAYGGAVMLEKYGAILGGRCVIGKILGGEMIFEKLSEADKAGLEKFYDSIRLSETDKTQRRTPRTLLNKKQCWDFAEEIISILS
ncbi:MAG: flavodoxin domain-containing protein [Deferribacterales bacterium]